MRVSSTWGRSSETVLLIACLHCKFHGAGCHLFGFLILPAPRPPARNSAWHIVGSNKHLLNGDTRSCAASNPATPRWDSSSLDSPGCSRPQEQ